MRAVVHRRYAAPHNALAIGGVSRPEPGPDEVLIRVRAASIHPDVWHAVTGRPFMLRLMGNGLHKPKRTIPGTDLAGVVHSVGTNVTTVAPGDEVFGETIQGHQWKNGGAFAEYATAPAEKIVIKPPALDFSAASTIPTSGLIAFMNVAPHIPAGGSVLVNGAGGGVGSTAIQLAKHYGASVTAVDFEDKSDMLRSLGADRTIDFRREDFLATGDRYDLIVDIPGNRSFEDLKRGLTGDGRYVYIGHDGYGARGGRLIGSGVPRFIKLSVRAPFGRRTFEPYRTIAAEDRLQTLADLAADGDLTPVVARSFPLEDAADALVHMANDNPIGRLVLSV